MCACGTHRAEITYVQRIYIQRKGFIIMVLKMSSFGLAGWCTVVIYTVWCYAVHMHVEVYVPYTLRGAVYYASIVLFKLAQPPHPPAQSLQNRLIVFPSWWKLQVNGRALEKTALNRNAERGKNNDKKITYDYKLRLRHRTLLGGTLLDPDVVSFSSSALCAATT